MIMLDGPLHIKEPAKDAGAAVIPAGVSAIPVRVTVIPVRVTVIPVRVAESRKEHVQRHADHHRLHPGAQADGSRREINPRNTCNTE
jgi:hypothetical protein